MERYKAKRLELTDMQQDLLNLEKSLSIAQGDETSRLQAVQILESKLAALAREIEQQEAKRERAIRWAQKHAKELRRSIHGLNALAGAVGAGGTGQQQGQGQAPGTGAGRGELTDEEIDIKTRELKERASTAIVELNKLSETHPELYEMLQGLFQKYHIQPPSRAVSRVASRAGSIRDDLSETSSVLSGGANNMRRSLMGHSSSRATPRMSMVSPVLGLQGADAMNRSESRASSEGGRGGEKRVSTTDLNATITLPPATNFSRSNSQRNLVASHPPPLPRSSSNSSSRSSSVNGTPAPGATAPLDFVLTGKNADPASSLNRSTGGKSGKKQQQQFQPITGANRVKTPARPGSAGSVSSRGSAASLKSERSGFGM
ncbi:hypothetical protein HK102_002018 [Quaeritorhiza haematococci]|nr:hypothetical protein HK102_002018 [Quaeritorhiza haematococci]